MHTIPRRADVLPLMRSNTNIGASHGDAEAPFLDDDARFGFEPPASFYEDAGVRALWEDIDPSVSGVPGIAVSLGAAHSEDSSSVFLGDCQKFDDAEVSDLSEFGRRAAEGPGRGEAVRIPGDRPRKRSARDVAVDETWYSEGTERQAFCFIRDHARNLRLATPSLSGRALQWRADALEFFFSDASLLKVSLNECCMAIHDEIRPDVVRLRIVYEMFEHNITLPAFFEECVSLPGIVRSRLLADDRYLDEAICEQVWFQPGVTTDVVIPRVIKAIESDSLLRKSVRPSERTPEVIMERLALLVEEGAIGMLFDCCYMIGRNPRAQSEAWNAAVPGREARERAVPSWSRLF